MQALRAPWNSLPNGEKREIFNFIPSKPTSTMAKQALLGESCTMNESWSIELSQFMSRAGPIAADDSSKYFYTQ
jgi:hypothetical protein